MHRFDPERSDITLFLNLFERQANRTGTETHDFVKHLLALLPVEVVELILGDITDKNDIFYHVKQILVVRYRLSHETYRQKFTKHARKPGSPWNDLIFELNGYFEGWQNRLEDSQFSELKDLLITDQIKR